MDRATEAVNPPATRGRVSDDKPAVGGQPAVATTNAPCYLARLRKVEGQVRGLARMVDADRDCVDVLTQINAARRALEQVALGLLREHIRRCVLDAARSDPVRGESKLNELSVALRRMKRM